MEWFYAVAGQKRGPYPLSEMKALLIAQEIGADTLIWRQGMEHWAALSSDAELRALLTSVPPPLPAAAGGEKAKTITSISDDLAFSQDNGTGQPSDVASLPSSAASESGAPWSRFFARGFDINLWLFLFLLVSSKKFPLFFQSVNAAPIESRTITYIILMFILTPFLFLFNAIIITVFDNSFGKMLFGLSVSMDKSDRRSGFTENVSRELLVWIKGLWLYLPIICVVPLISNYKRVSKGKPAVYDEGRRQDVVALPIGHLRRTFAILVSLGVVVAVAAYQSALQK